MSNILSHLTRALRNFTVRQARNLISENFKMQSLKHPGHFWGVLASVLVLTVVEVGGLQSKLRVAACSQLYPPFVDRAADGSLIGYDVSVEFSFVVAFRCLSSHFPCLTFLFLIKRRPGNGFWGAHRLIWCVVILSPCFFCIFVFLSWSLLVQLCLYASLSINFLGTMLSIEAGSILQCGHLFVSIVPCVFLSLSLPHSPFCLSFLVSSCGLSVQILSSAFILMVNLYTSLCAIDPQQQICRP